MKRWYDSHRVGKQLDLFKCMSKKKRDPIVLSIMQIIKKHGSSFIDDAVIEFPLEPLHRRWYDDDPYLWLMFNGLQKADEKLLNEVATYLEITLKADVKT